MNENLPVVVLDPGHGGSTPVGASSPNNAVGPNGLLEKDVALDLARRVAGELAGRARVVFTREADVNLSLTDRAKKVVDGDAALFASIHLNGFTDAGVNGTEAWVARSAGERSRSLARALLDRLTQTGLRDLGVREGDLGVLLPARHDLATAACLLEVSFLTNPEEASRLADEQYKARIARAIADALASELSAPAVASTLQVATRIDGIDTFSRNRLPGWDDLRVDGIQFAILKATEGRTFVDDGTVAGTVPGGSFFDRRRTARENTFLVGAYHYGRASGNLADAPDLLRAQADNFIGALGRILPGELPPSYDFEEAHNTGAVPWRGADWLAPMEAFLDRIETALGRVPMIYTSRRIFRDFLNDDPVFSRFGEYPLWVVRWPAQNDRYRTRLTLNPPLPAAWSDWAILQYSGDFTPPEFTNLHAVETGMDMNVSNGGIHVIRGLAGLGRPAPHGDTVRFVAYADESGAIKALTFLGYWLEADLTELARHPDAAQGPRSAGDVAACEVGGKQFVAFRGLDDRHLYELERDGAQMTVNDLTASVVNAGTANDPHYLRPASDPTYLVNGSERALVYWGESNHQYLLRTSGGAWQLPAIDITASAGIADASGDATPFVSQGTLHLISRAGLEGHLVDARVDGHTVTTRDLTAEGGATAATYQPAPYAASDGAVRIVFRALRGGIHQLHADTAAEENLSQLSGGAPTCAGSPAAFVLNGVAHVVFRRPDGRLHEISGNDAGGWRHAQLPCDEPAAADPAASVITEGAFVVYRGRSGFFHELALADAGWTCRTIQPTVNTL